jgi:hypothetical protein
LAAVYWSIKKTTTSISILFWRQYFPANGHDTVKKEIIAT